MWEALGNRHRFDPIMEAFAAAVPGLVNKIT
jgi:hypothetical protein